MKWSSQKTVLFEVAMIKLCGKEETPNAIGLEDLINKVNKLEEKINSGNIKVSKAEKETIEQKGKKQFEEIKVGKVNIEQVSIKAINKADYTTNMFNIVLLEAEGQFVYYYIGRKVSNKYEKE